VKNDRVESIANFMPASILTASLAARAPSTVNVAVGTLMKAGLTCRLGSN
jgi:hypothetical protein